MNILIAGGAGFIGSNLSTFLLSENHSVWVVDNVITGRKENISSLLNNPHFNFIEADVTNHDAMQQWNNQAFDIIFHLASPASPIQFAIYPLETLNANSVGTKNLLDLARKNTITKLVYASTSEVYGDPLEHPQKETYWGNVNSYGPRSCYDESKRFGEALCYTYAHSYGVDVRVVRIFNTYGPYMEKDDGRVISNLIVQALTNKPMTLYGNGMQTRSFSYVSDLVDGLYRMAVKETKGMIINLGNPVEESVLTIAHKIKALTNSPSEIVFGPLPEDDPKRRKPDISKAQKILGWEPKISLEEGLVKTIAYFKHILSI